MDLSPCVKAVNILNIDENESTLSPSQLISNSNGTQHFIVSDTDQEILILIKFKQIVSLKSMIIYANATIVKDNIDDISEPKELSIYKIQHLAFNFDDLQSLSADKSIECSKNKLSKGQVIKLQNNSKSAIKFKNSQFIAIYIKSNQDNTEKTIINSISLKGEINNKQSDTNTDIDQPQNTQNIKHSDDIFDDDKEKKIDLNNLEIFKIESNQCYLDWNCNLSKEYICIWCIPCIPCI